MEMISTGRNILSIPFPTNYNINLENISMEALILYLVLFFPGMFASGFSGRIELAETIPFSVIRELGRTLTYTIPSLALLWYIIFDKKLFSFLKLKRPQKQDLFSFAAGLLSLLIIGIGISILVSKLSQNLKWALPPKIEAPANILGWIVMVISCLCTGYLEESFFRCYLLINLEKSLPRVVFRVFFSTLLFSLCHIYEGAWGIVNAVLAGFLLSLLFIRYRSLHGIAWAHGFYNVFVYAMGVLV
jgi:membrane protease YdiL (CAAX protease family)